MSVYVLLKFSNKLGKNNKMIGLPSIYGHFALSLIDSIIQEHDYILFII